MGIDTLLLLIIVGTMFGLGFFLGWLATAPLYKQGIRELQEKMVDQRLKILEDKVDKLETSTQ